MIIEGIVQHSAQKQALSQLGHIAKKKNSQYKNKSNFSLARS